MRKNRPSLLLSALTAAALLFAGAFFLGRATAPQALRIETQRQTAESDTPAQTDFISSALEKAASAAQSTQTLDLNTASVEQLMQLPGVGQTTAERIVAYRERYGRFVTVEQLLDVQGIGQGLLSQLRDLVTVNTAGGTG